MAETRKLKKEFKKGNLAILIKIIPYKKQYNVIPINVIKANIPCIRRMIILLINTGKKPIKDKVKLDITDSESVDFFNLGSIGSLIISVFI